MYVNSLTFATPMRHAERVLDSTMPTARLVRKYLLTLFLHEFADYSSCNFRHILYRLSDNPEY